MPDENTNPVGTTQISQNDQATTSQNWNDFTIDFWWGENKDEITSEWVELNLEETGNEEGLWDSKPEIDLWFNEETQESETTESNISIQDLDSLFNDNQNDGASISPVDTKQDIEEKNEVEDNSFMFNEESNAENSQETTNETNNQELNISLDDTKEEGVEDNQEFQENSVGDDNSVIFEEENKIEDIQETIDETSNQELNISLDDTKEEGVEDNQEIQWDIIEDDTPVISEEENKIEDLQKTPDETNNQELNISLDDTKQEEAEDNQEIQEDNVGDDSNTINEEVVDNQESEEINNGETIDINDNQEENTGNDILSDSPEVDENEDKLEMEDDVDEKNIWDLEKNPDQWDDFSISFNDNWNTGSKENQESNMETEEINVDTNNEIQTSEDENKEEPEMLDEENTGVEPEQINNEESLVENDNTEVNLAPDTENVETVESTENTETTESNLSPDQQNFSENESENNLVDNTDSAEISPENENNPTEIVNNENLEEEPKTENIVNDIESNNNEENLEPSIENEMEPKKQDLGDLDFAMDFDLNNDEASSQGINQPAIWNMMEESLTNSQLWDSINDANTSNISEENLVNPVEEINNSNAENTNDLNDEVASKQGLSQNNITEEDANSNEQSFSLDYTNTEENKPEEIQNNNYTMDNANQITDIQNDNSLQSSENGEQQPAFSLDSMDVSVNENSQQSLTENNNEQNLEQNLEQNQADQVNKSSESLDSESKEWDIVVNQTEIATLSLDQILDSELNSNPEYADNSRAVPKNVPRNSGFFNKKTVWILAGGLILAGFVVALAFPFKKTERKIWDTVLTWSEIEEQEHYTWDNPYGATYEYTEDQPEQGETIQTQDTTSKSTAGAEVIEFPDVGEESWEEDTTSWKEWWPLIIETAQPYTCEGDECEDQTQKTVNPTLDEVVSTISNFKSYAENYYSQWDEAQDKKLVKYALQIINLCNIYEKQIDNEENITQESFDEFKSKVWEIELKIVNYVGSEDEMQTFTSGTPTVENNFSDEMDTYY